MKGRARFARILERSEEDRCYVGSSPCLMYGGCHGADEKRIFDELCRIVEESIELYHQDGRPFPRSTSGRDIAERVHNVT